MADIRVKIKAHVRPYGGRKAKLHGLRKTPDGTRMVTIHSPGGTGWFRDLREYKATDIEFPKDFEFPDGW